MGSNKNKKWMGILGAFLIFSVASVGLAPADEGNLYLKNNLHAQQSSRDLKASYANWTDPGTGHSVIPVNTPVKFQKGGHIRGSVFTIVLQDSGKTVLFEFDKRRMAMEPEEYWKLIASPSKVDLTALSQIDQKGIREGKAFVGMTKDGVRMALGYPAAHRTASLKENQWIYWTNRFRSFVVEFDAGGKVVGIR